MPGSSERVGDHAFHLFLLSLLDLLRQVIFHVAEMVTVLAGGDFQGALKDVPHRVDVSEAAFAGDHFHAVMTFFQAPACCFDAQTLNKLGRRCLHFFDEDACEISRTHRYAFCQ